MIQQTLAGDAKTPTHFNRLGLIFCTQGRYDEAVKLSLDIPHIGLGTIEIRQVMVYNT